MTITIELGSSCLVSNYTTNVFFAASIMIPGNSNYHFMNAHFCAKIKKRLIEFDCVSVDYRTPIQLIEAFCEY